MLCQSPSVQVFQVSTKDTMTTLGQMLSALTDIVGEYFGMIQFLIYLSGFNLPTDFLTTHRKANT